MVDSNETFTKLQCYRTGLGREAGEGRFLGKINKFINKSVVMGFSALAAHQSRVVKSRFHPVECHVAQQPFKMRQGKQVAAGVDKRLAAP
ncbi:hypothetical protein ACK345_11600 [Aeromonas rivipollensis]|uniref:hypothetical protein n=1 Tax=Aeromonas rivipollensis TaxID=948519 RepID=UPI003985D5C1